MKHSDFKLISFGSSIDDIRKQMHIAIDLLCADLKCSKSTYSKV